MFFMIDLFFLGRGISSGKKVMKGYYHVSSHFHFLLYGTSEECRRLADEYKRRCAMGMRLRSGEVQGLINMVFRKESIVQLSMDQRLELCLLMKKNFNAGVRQIARITRLDPELVAKVV